MEPNNQLPVLLRQFSQNPDDPQILGQLAEIYYKSNNLNEALEYCFQAIEKKPFHNTSANQKAGDIFLKQNNTELASIYYARAIQINKFNYLAYYGLGCCYDLQGRYGDAKINFQKAIEYSPDDFKEAKEKIQNLDRLAGNPQYFVESLRYNPTSLIKQQILPHLCSKIKNLIIQSSIAQQKLQYLNIPQSNLDELQKQIYDLQQQLQKKNSDELDLQALQNQNNLINEKLEQLEKQNQQFKQVLQDSGSMQKAELKKGFFELLNQQDLPLFQYCKTFYWTLLNYIQAYRVISTNQISFSEETSITDDFFDEVVSQIKGFVQEILNFVPFIGYILEDAQIENKNQHKLKVIQKLTEDLAFLEEDLSIQIGLTALHITKVQKQNIINLQQQIQQETKIVKKNTQAQTWFQKKLNRFWQSQKQQENKFLEDEMNFAKKLAYEDVSLLLCQLFNQKIPKKINVPLSQYLLETYKSINPEVIVDTMYNIKSKMIPTDKNKKKCFIFCVTDIIYDDPFINLLYLKKSFASKQI